MGSNDDDAVTVNEPFSIRDYVLVARQKDISQNWPFPEKCLETCLKHGVTKVLPPFESCNFMRSTSYREEDTSGSAEEDNAHASINKNCVEFNRKEEIKVYNIDVSTSSTISSFDYQTDQCLTAVPSCKSFKSKRKKRKGNKLKKRSMADICAKARPCTLEELDKINGSNWAIDQHVIYGGAITSDQVVEEVDGSMNLTEDNRRGTKSAETSRKTMHQRENNAETDNVVVNKGQLLKIKLNCRKSKSQNIKMNPRITNESKIRDIPVAKSQGKCSTSTNGTVSQPEFQNRRGKLPERSAVLRSNNSIEAGKDPGQSERIKLKTRDSTCLKGLGSNAFTQYSSVISDKNILKNSRRQIGIRNKEQTVPRLKGFSDNSSKQHPSVMSNRNNSCKKQKQERIPK